MIRGEIWLVDFADPIGCRPAIVISRGSQDKENPFVMVIRTTKNLYQKRFPYTIMIEPSDLNRLDLKSVAMVHQMIPLLKEDFVHKIGDLENHYMAKIISELKELLRIP